MRSFKVFLFVVVFLVFMVSSDRPKTGDDIVALLTRRQWFADNNVDYMLSLANPTNAYLDIGPISFGGTAATNFFISINPDGATINKWTIFHAFSSSNPALTFKVVLKSETIFEFTIGNKVFEIQKAVRNTPVPTDENWDGTNPAINKDIWNHINIDIAAIDANTSVVTIHVNTRFWNKAIVDTNLLAGFRDNSYLGATYNEIKQSFENFLVGYVDNFAIFGIASDVAWRKAVRTLPFVVDQDRKNAIELLIDFNDALVSVGTTTVAITKTVKPDVFWVVAVLKSGASFVPRSNLDKWFSCYATGDPHGYRKRSYDLSYTRIANLEDQPSGRVFVRCGGDNDQGVHNASELEVRTYTRYTFWWRWSVFRVVAIRYIDWIYRCNLDETSSIAHPDIGYLTPKLNIPEGAYRKHISSVDWQPIPVTTSIAFTLEPTTGALYGHYHQGSFRTLHVKVPGFGVVKVDAPEGVWSSCRYMNLYVTLNEDICPDIKRGRCTCDNFLDIAVDPLYRDWLPPPPLPDNVEPKPHPCTLVDLDFKNEAQNICSRIYPTDTAKRDDCIFDACAAGDIEVVLLNKPTPECMLKGLFGNTTACLQLYCPNFCSFRGTCNPVTKSCVCDVGYVGKDCGQRKSFSCYNLGFGNQSVKVSSQYAPSSASTSITALENEFFGTFGVEGSVLLYTVFDKNGTEHLFLVNNHATGPSAGSYDICITALVGSVTNVKIVNKANSNCLGKHETKVNSPLCFSFTWEAYGSGGLILDLKPTSGELGLSFAISNEKGLKQVVYGSANGKGYLDVLKVPQIYHNSFLLELSVCDAELCSIYDQKCKDCSDQPKCGYCVESGRCMLGDKSGPFGGVCLNWRFTFDDAVSRVVTVEYDTLDLVNPDTEVFLSTASSPEAGVPVNIYAPTLTKSFATDALLIFSTHGDFATFAQQFKRNFANLLPQFSDENVNFGLGFYDAVGAELTLAMTRADPNNFFSFTRALEAILGRTSSGNGGQQFALNLAASGNSISVGFRQHSKRYAFITVYGHKSSEKNAILALRDTVINANYLPIWVIVGENNATRDFFQNEIIGVTNGIPGIVLAMRSDADDLYKVIRNGIKFGSTLPTLIIKSTDASNNHIDFSVLNQQPDTLFVSGLSDSGLRAWFRIPMKRGDGLHHVAEIAVPGFGKATIADVSNTKPIAQNRSFAGDEGIRCLQITLMGSSYHNLLPVIFVITTLPTQGQLFEYDPSKPDNLGAPVGLGTTGVSDGTSANLCYKPNLRFFHGLDSFTYKAFEGCSYSNIATISIEIRDINLQPISGNTAFTIMEKQNASLSGLFKCTGGDEGEVIHIKIMDISVNAPTFLQPFNSQVVFVNSQVLTPGWTGANTVPVVANEFEMAVNGDYKVADSFFWGVWTLKYQCVDDLGLSSYPSNAVITVQQVIDPPVILLKSYTPVEDVWYEVKFDVKDFDVPLTSVSVSQVSTLFPYTISATAGGSPLSLPYTCYNLNTQFSTTCSFFYKLNDANRNSCPGGFGNCAVSQLQTTTILRVTASDGTLSSQSIISLSVYPTNDPPVVSAPATLTTPEFTPLDFVVTLTDPDNDFSASNLLFTNFNNEFTVAKISEQKFATRVEYTVRVNPVFNVFGDFTFEIYGFDGLLTSTAAVVSLKITYVNDPPIPIPVIKTLIEDTSDFIDITQLDPDNTPNQLTYKILNVPLIPNSNIPKYIIKDENKNDLDLSLPLPGPIIYVTPSPDYFTAFGSPDDIIFSVTDKHLFNNAIPGNTVNSVLKIAVNSVNDPPVCVSPFVILSEDDYAIISLLGLQPAYGEANQLYTSVVTKLPHDLIDPSKPDQGTFYQYDPQILTMTTQQFVQIATPIAPNGGVTDALHRIIYIPPKDKNSDILSPAALRVNPYFSFYVTDGLQSGICDNIPIIIESVNDKPVAWNKPWLGRPDIQYKGINPVTNTWETTTTECFRLCKGKEDEDLNIYLGGQDIENTPPTVDFTVRFRIVDIPSCPTGVYIKYNDNDDVTVQINSFPAELDKDFPAGKLNGIIFHPAPDTFNAPNPNFVHPALIGKYSELYCKVVYTVIDSSGTESDPQTIDISIQEQNDVPTCSQLPANLVPLKCKFLTNITIIGGSDGDFTYMFTEIVSYEDKDVWIYVNFDDVEDDPFIPHLMECNPSNGKFFTPRDAAQAQFINDDGSIGNLALLLTKTKTTPVNCGPFVNGPIESLENSTRVTIPPVTGVVRGYYIRFIPNNNEFGNLYNKLGILVQDDVSGQSKFLVMYYFLTILPVNDAPSIFLISYPGQTVAPATSQAVQYNIQPTVIVQPIAKIEDPDTEPGVPSMTVTVTSTSLTAIVNALDMDGNNFVITSASPLSYTGSIAQVNKTLSTLSFQSADEGVFTVKITINDNGATGNCPPNSGQTPQPDGSCPQITNLEILFNVAFSNSISGPLAIAASAGLGGLLVLGAAVTFIAVRKFKNKKTESWKEFDEENFKDIGHANPLYEEETVSGTNPLYVSSRESLELSN